MPLLPRTRRGTWLLAGAVWVAACAGLWWVLPVAPRAVIPVDEGVREFNFSPDGKCLVTHGFQRTENAYQSFVPSCFNIWDCNTGEHVAGPIEVSGALLGISPDRRWWCLQDKGANGKHIQLFDVVNRRFEILDAIEHLNEWIRESFTSDSRLLLTEEIANDHEALVIWDLHQHRIIGRLPDARLPAELSPDGRLLAVTASQADDEPVIRILDRASLQPLKTLSGRVGDKFRTIAFTSDSEHLIATFGERTRRADGGLGDVSNESGLRCWQISSGAERFKIQNLLDRFAFARSTQSILTRHYDDPSHRIDSRDFATGGIRQIALPGTVTLSFGNECLSPDGGSLVLQNSSEPPEILQRLLRSLGLSSWLESDDTRHDYCSIFDTNYGHLLGQFAGWNACWSPDGKVIGAFSGTGYPAEGIALWDIPPRKSLTWFTAGAAVFALPIAMIARRRIRKLRAA
jgi:WD40 repeat protein